MRIFVAVIPFHQRAVLGITAHQRDRFRDHVYRLRAVQRDPIFRRQPKDAFHRSETYRDTKPRENFTVLYCPEPPTHDSEISIHDSPITMLDARCSMLITDTAALRAVLLAPTSSLCSCLR